MGVHNFRQLSFVLPGENESPFGTHVMDSARVPQTGAFLLYKLYICQKITQSIKPFDFIMITLTASNFDSLS